MSLKIDLQGKKVFITGGTGGIGSYFVPLLKKAGAEVILYQKNQEGDLVQNLDTIKSKLQKNTPDILINMAGYNDLNYAEKQNYNDIVALNMMVPMQLVQAVLPAMRKRNSGHIVNVGSMIALVPLPHLTGYVAAKSGLKGFNDSLRRELSGTNIFVTHVIPRAVKTKMNTGIQAELNEKIRVRYDDPKEIAEIIFQAILKKSKEVRIGWPERFFAFLNANFPFFIDNELKKNCQIGETILNAKQN